MQVLYIKFQPSPNHYLTLRLYSRNITMLYFGHYARYPTYVIRLPCTVSKVPNLTLYKSIRRIHIVQYQFSYDTFNPCRHSFEYSDREGTVIAHIASGIDAVIKLPCHWPLVNSTLKLLSLKGPNNSTKEFSSRSWNFVVSFIVRSYFLNANNLVSKTEHMCYNVDLEWSNM